MSARAAAHRAAAWGQVPHNRAPVHSRRRRGEVVVPLAGFAYRACPHPAAARKSLSEQAKIAFSTAAGGAYQHHQEKRKT